MELASNIDFVERYNSEDKNFEVMLTIVKKHSTADCRLAFWDSRFRSNFSDGFRTQ